MKRLARKRREALLEDENLKITRDQLFNNVTSIIMRHINDAQRLLPEGTEGAKLFHEMNFTPAQWNIYTANGYSSTMPLFYYYFEKIDYVETPCQQQDLTRFMRDIIDKMQLATECIVISLIYIEKIMVTGKIEIRYFNWKPLLFTAILLASKFWEDINFWNIDYVEQLDLYPLKAINRMESEFISLCDYNIYVSAKMYARYQIQVRQLSNPVVSGGGPPAMGDPRAAAAMNMGMGRGTLKLFNRFKQGSTITKPPSPPMGGSGDLLIQSNTTPLLDPSQ